MRKTKIVATIGPASSDPAVFAAMCKAGVNVARLNFSHGTHEEQLAKIRNILHLALDAPNARLMLSFAFRIPEGRWDVIKRATPPPPPR